MVKQYFYSREDGVNKCWEVKPNDLLQGWFILTDCKAKDGWCEVRPMPPNRYKEVITGRENFYSTSIKR